MNNVNVSKVAKERLLHKNKSSNKFKKIFLLVLIPFSLIGTTLAIALPLTMCKSKNQSKIISEIHLKFSNDNQTVLGFNEKYDATWGETLVIPKSHNSVNVTKIGSYAFEHATGITEVDLSNSQIDHIGLDAFENNLSIKLIKLSDSLASIADGAFADCPNIVGLSLTHSSSISSPTYQLVDGTNGNYVTDGSLKSNAFLQKSSDVNSVSTIGATSGGLATKTLTIPSSINGQSITQIGSYAFYLCSNVTTINLPNTLSAIGERSFRGTEITSLTLPPLLSSLGDSVFWGDNKLNSITANYNTGQSFLGFSSKAFLGISSNGVLQNNGSYPKANLLAEFKQHDLPSGWIIQ